MLDFLSFTTAFPLSQATIMQPVSWICKIFMCDYFVAWEN
jgi:hypothetical protein